jgi:hypothetical protein
MPSYEPHPRAAEFKIALSEIDEFIGELSHEKYRVWAWEKCMGKLGVITQSDPPASASLWNEITAAKNLIDQARRSKRSEYRLVERIRDRIAKAKRVCDYPPRDYWKVALT